MEFIPSIVALLLVGFLFCYVAYKILKPVNKSEEPEAPLKLCKDCKFFELNPSESGGIIFSTCKRNIKEVSNPYYHLIDGKSHIEKTHATDYCSVERQFDCGKEAKFFQPKNP